MNSIDLLSNYDDVLLPEDIMQILKRGRNSVYKALATGEIRSKRCGKGYRIPKLYMLDYLYPEKGFLKEENED